MHLRIRIQRTQPHPRLMPGSNNPDLFCQHCHGRISPEEKFCAHCDAVILRRYCPGCRKLVPDHEVICPYCRTSAADKPPKGILHYALNASPMILVLFFLTLLIVWPDKTQDSKANLSQTNDHKKTTTTHPSGSVHKEIVPNGAEGRIKAVPPKSTEISLAKDIEEGARLNLKGHTLIKQGRYSEAVPLLSQAVETFPEDANIIDYVFAQYNLGHSLRKIGKSEDAIPYLERCVAYDRQNQMFQRELQAARRDLSRKEDY